MKTETGMQCPTYHSTGIVCAGCEMCAPVATQPAAASESVDMPEFRNMLRSLQASSVEYVRPKTEEIIAHINAWNATNVAALKHQLWCAEVNLDGAKEQLVAANKPAAPAAGQVATASPEALTLLNDIAALWNADQLEATSGLESKFDALMERAELFLLRAKSASAAQPGAVAAAIIREAIEATFEERAGWRTKIAAAVRALAAPAAPAVQPTPEQIEQLAQKHAAWVSKGPVFGVHFYAESLANFVNAIRPVVSPVAAAVPEVSAAARDVLAERQRQVSVEGWGIERDDKYIDCELARAAATYALCTSPEQLRLCDIPAWPWPLHWWKPTTYRRNLVKAGALLLAEIERADRASVRAAGPAAPTTKD